MTYFFLLLSILIWPFGQLLTFHVGGISTAIYLLDISLALTALSSIFSPEFRRQSKADFLFRPLCIFLFIATVSLLVNLPGLPQSESLTALFYLLRLYIYPSAYFAIKFISMNQLEVPLKISFIIFCVLGLLQYFLLPDMRFLKLIGFDDHYYRLIGSFFDPNFTGAILGAGALFFVASSNWTPAVVTTLLLAATFSRASYLCFLLGLLFILLKNKKIIHLSLLLLLALAVVFVPKPFGEGVNLFRTFSIFSRFDSWSSGISLFLEKPIFGWGYNTLRSITGERFQIDNSYIYIAATTGLAGMVSFVYLLYRSLSGTKRLPELSFILCIILHSLFNNSIFYIWILFAYWVILGLGTKEYKQS